MRPIRVLLIDDNAAFLRAAAQFLRGHADIILVRSVLGGGDALARVEALRPDVVLIDLAMPDVPGLDLIPRLRSARPDVGIVALSFLDVDAYRQAALAAGADAFVSKAATGSDLLPAIRQVAQAQVRRPESGGKIGHVESG
jgi:DNA-binding NarL/FixJ family response regulator